MEARRVERAYGAGRGTHHELVLFHVGLSLNLRVVLAPCSPQVCLSCGVAPLLLATEPRLDCHRRLAVFLRLQLCSPPLRVALDASTQLCRRLLLLLLGLCLCFRVKRLPLLRHSVARLPAWHRESNVCASGGPPGVGIARNMVREGKHTCRAWPTGCTQLQIARPCRAEPVRWVTAVVVHTLGMDSAGGATNAGVGPNHQGVHQLKAQRRSSPTTTLAPIRIQAQGDPPLGCAFFALRFLRGQRTARGGAGRIKVP